MKLRIEKLGRLARRDKVVCQLLVDHLFDPANARLYPVFQYGLLASRQCASRCPSAGPCRCHSLQCLHHTTHRTTPSNSISLAGRTGASKSITATALIGTFIDRCCVDCFWNKNRGGPLIYLEKCRLGGVLGTSVEAWNRFCTNLDK